MKIIADIVARYTLLQGMAEDPNVINSDGSKVDAYRELAAELFEVPISEVNASMLEHVARIVRATLEKEILVSQWTKKEPFPWKT